MPEPAVPGRVELAQVGGDLRAVAVPLVVEPIGAEVPTAPGLVPATDSDADEWSADARRPARARASSPRRCSLLRRTVAVAPLVEPSLRTPRNARRVVADGSTPWFALWAAIDPATDTSTSPRAPSGPPSAWAHHAGRRSMISLRRRCISARSDSLNGAFSRDLPGWALATQVPNVPR